MCASLCICLPDAGTPYFFQVFVFLFAPADAAVSSRLYHTVPQALTLSTLYFRHGATAVAQKVCVDLFHACVEIANIDACV